jgi:adenylylsulfate reductase subunit B
METKTLSWVKEIKIDHDCCKSCKSCVNACFADVIRWDEKTKKPVVAYPEDCACPEQCIEVIPNIPAPLRSSY